MFNWKTDNQNTISIKFRRDSVSMGDDVMAPHEQKFTFSTSDTLYELLNKASEYVPGMHDFEWEVMCDKDVLGRLVSNEDTNYHIKLEANNIKLSKLPEYEIFCRKKFKHQTLSFFEKEELLYDGEYFTITLFREYGDFKAILEKGETKITTMNKEFALSHGFTHRDLNNYDKILPIDEFEGLRIVRIPNSLDAAVEYIIIPKDKVREELEKRAGILSA